MKKIFLLTDYKGNFGTKYYASPYRSGMNQKLLHDNFTANNFEPTFLQFAAIDFRTMSFKDELVLYTSAEDCGTHYKTYIDDMLYGLVLQGAKLIPDYPFFKAHDNKVFMEILRDILPHGNLKNNIRSKYFGTIEEAKEHRDVGEASTVVKAFSGSMGKSVYLANDHKDLIKKIKRISRSRYILHEIKDRLRIFKHKGYLPDSRYRNKYILQNYIPALENDWKVLVFDKKFYILYRRTRKKDFRASGSGNFLFKKDIPEGILDFAESVYNALNVPVLSIDVGFDGNSFILFEFQAIYFGTTTIDKSGFYFTKTPNGWELIEGKSVLENEYAASVCAFIKRA